MGLSTWIADLAARGNAMDKYRDVLNKSRSVSEAVSKVRYIYICVYVYIYMFVCMYVCAFCVQDLKFMYVCERI